MNALRFLNSHRQLFLNWPETFLRAKVSPLLHPVFARGRCGISCMLRNGSSDFGMYAEIFGSRAYRHTFALIATLETGERVVDIGANVGFFTLKALQVNPDIVVQAYEPMPDSAECWRANIALNRCSHRATLQQVAIDACSATTTMYLNGGHASASLHYPRGDRFVVEALGVNAALAALPGKIALLKIDIEGGEYEVIEALSEENWARIDAISIEIHGRAGKSRAALRNAIERRGFPHVSEEDTNTAGEDCLLFQRSPRTEP